MIKALADAIEKVRQLPAEEQAHVASLLEEFVDGNVPDVVLDAEERKLVEEGLADIEAGRIVPTDEMAAFWKKLTS